MRGYEHANGIALDLWEEVYPPNSLTLLALTDTFSTKAFFQVRARSLPTAPLKIHSLTHPLATAAIGLCRRRETCPSLARLAAGLWRPVRFCPPGQRGLRAARHRPPREDDRIF